MQVLKRLSEENRPDVLLVEIENQKYVYKKTKPEIIYSEKKFQNLLKELDLPYIKHYPFDWLKPDELVMEYLEEAPTLDSLRDPKYNVIWGSHIKKVHTQKAKYPQKIDSNGNLMDIDWNNYMKGEIEHNARKVHNLMGEEITKLFTEKLLKKLITDEITNNLTVIHGDMHSNNEMVIEDKVVLFDKSDVLWASSPYEDLATVCIEYPNGLFIETKDSDYKDDTQLREAFFKGYGTYNKDLLNAFCLLFAAKSISNTHVKYQKEMIESLMILK